MAQENPAGAVGQGDGDGVGVAAGAGAELGAGGREVAEFAGDPGSSPQPASPATASAAAGMATARRTDSGRVT
jgi:hypothetical protein